MSDTLVSEQDPAARLATQWSLLTPFSVRVGPLGHIAAERERLNGLRFQHFDVKQLSATVGAELSGLDLREELPDEVVVEIRQALLDFKVIFFRDQPVTPEQHVAFARRFGQLEVHPFIPGNKQVPELVRFEKTPDVGGYENQWHHDVTWREVPSLGAVLHGIEIPPTGGDTLFSDSCAAYDGLDPELKAQIETMTATHDFVKAFGANVPEDKLAEMREKYPAQEHPVASTHPETGRKYLNLNRTFVSHLDGVPVADAVELVDLLCRQADYPEYQCRFRWEPDSIAFWDNRAVQHYATSDYWPARRVMERASIIGSRPR